MEESKEIEKCPICLDEIGDKNSCVTECGHNFCLKCLYRSLKEKNTCPMCRQALQYFTYNGLSTRIISVEKEEVVQTITPNIPVVTVTQFFYNTMKYCTMLSVSANVISLYVITQYCDI